eukprot:3394761-Heterocapsa_arctica.AAC.1
MSLPVLPRAPPLYAASLRIRATLAQTNRLASATRLLALLTRSRNYMRKRRRRMRALMGITRIPTLMLLALAIFLLK